MSRRILAVALTLALAGGAATVASASSRHGERDHDHHREGDHDRGRLRSEAGIRAAPLIDVAYAKECGSCHLAFPRRMLPAESWKKLMAGLDRHFGVDAELEPDVRDGIERWLVEGAGRAPRRGDPAPLRITERRWFQGEHRKAARAVAANPSIKSIANCAACHSGAERWDFDEDRVNIPRG